MHDAISTDRPSLRLAHDAPLPDGYRFGAYAYTNRWYVCRDDGACALAEILPDLTYLAPEDEAAMSLEQLELAVGAQTEGDILIELAGADWRM